MADTKNQNTELIIAHSVSIVGLTAALTVLTEALLDSCIIDKELMLKTIDKHCAKFSNTLLENDEYIASADRILLDIRKLVSDRITKK